MLTRLQKASLRELGELIIELADAGQMNSVKDLKTTFEERVKRFGDFDTFASDAGNESPDEPSGPRN